MAIKKYLDWRGYFEGLYLSWIKTLTSTLLGYVGTNAVETMGIAKIGLTWQQALGVAASVTFIEVLRYLNTKPKPDTITETADTQIINKP
jgi:hypothetical protein